MKNLIEMLETTPKGLSASICESSIYDLSHLDRDMDKLCKEISKLTRQSKDDIKKALQAFDRDTDIKEVKPAEFYLDVAEFGDALFYMNEKTEQIYAYDAKADKWVEIVEEGMDANACTKIAKKISDDLKLNYKKVLKAVMKFDDDIEDIREKFTWSKDDKLPYKGDKKPFEDAQIDGTTLIFTDKNDTRWAWDAFNEEWYKIEA